MVKKYFFVGLFLLWAFFLPFFAIGQENADMEFVENSGCNGVIISEFIPNPSGNDSEGEWIELYNDSDTEMNLDGYSISDTEGSIESYSIKDINILPRDFVVFYRETTKITLNNDKESIVLKGPDGSKCQTELAIVDSNKDMGLEGQSFAYDKESNTWRWTTSPTPGSANVFHTNDSDSDDEDTYNGCAGIMITELMPSPAGSDEENEWIEVYNSNGETVDLGGCILSDKLKAGSTKKYTIPMSTQVASGGYLKFTRPITKITLNNDSDGIILLSSDGVLIFDTGLYTDVQENLSYAYHEGQWFWSSTPTPGTVNVITELPQKETKKASSTKKKKDKVVKNPPKSTKKSANKKSANKKSANGGEVLGANSEDDASQGKVNDKVMGYILVTLAGVLLVGYVVYINKDFILENTLGRFKKS